LGVAVRVVDLLGERSAQALQILGERGQVVARAGLGGAGEQQGGGGGETGDSAHVGAPGNRYVDSAMGDLNGQVKSVAAGAAPTWRVQGAGGGGAMTVRSPLCSGGLTMPAASIASISRAARL